MEYESHKLARSGLWLYLVLALLFMSPADVYSAEDNGDSLVSFNFDAPPPTINRISDSLSWGAEVRLKLEKVDNEDLDSGDDDQVTAAEPLVRTTLSYTPSDRLRGFLDLQLSGEQIVSQGDEQDKEDETHLRLREAYLLFPKLSDSSSLQLGRQRFKDTRGWLYDSRMDSVRYYYRTGPYGVQLSASRRVFVGDDFLKSDDNDDTSYFILSGRYTLTDDADLRPYVIVRNSTAEDDNEDPVFLGIQSVGDISTDLKYWFNAAYVAGESDYKDIRAWGTDFGAAFRFDAPWRPALTISAAYGSGDNNPDDNVDRNFRQTGLEENRAKNYGVTRFRYYGEVLDPELSNMLLLTGGFGVRPTKKSSIDLVYHYYRQDVASDELRDADIDEDPNGVSKELGDELDLVIGYRGIKNVKLRLKFGAFFPGSAFTRHTDPSYIVKFRIAYRF